LDSKLCKNNPVLKELDIQDMYEDECEIASGSILLIIGIVGLFLTGVTTCAISGRDEPRKEKEKEKEKKKQDEDEKDEEEPTSKKDSEPEEPLEEVEPGDAKKSAVIAD
jgi:flagellar biosynthesis component FlhA